MRFSIATVLAAALSGTALGAPSTVKSRSLETEASGFATQVEQGVHVSQVEPQLINILGGEAVLKVEKEIGESLSDRLIGVSQKGTQQAGAQAGLIQAVLEALAKLAEGLGLDEVNAWLNDATNGELEALEDAIGITDLLRELGLA